MIARRSKRFILESQFDNDDVISDRLPSSIVSCNRAKSKETNYLLIFSSRN